MTNEIIAVNHRAVEERNLFSDNLVERFIKFAAVKPKSASTYITALKQLFKFLAANGIAQPKRGDIENWRDALKTGAIDKNGVIHSDGEVTTDGKIYRRKVVAQVVKFYLVDTNGNEVSLAKSPSTIQLYVNATRLFFGWLSQEGLYPNITNHFKTGVKVGTAHKKDPLDATQAGLLIKNVGAKTYKTKRGKDRKVNTLKIKRDRAILALLACSALRTIEVIRLDKGDMYDSYGKTYVKVQGKGHDEKDSDVLIPTQVKALIDEYLAERGTVADTEPLFTSTANSNRGQRLSTQTISKMVKANLRANGLDSPRLTAHSLRRSAITIMLFNGVALTDVQQCARHSNLNTTQIYNDAVKRLKNTAEQTAADSIFGSAAFGL